MTILSCALWTTVIEKEPPLAVGLDINIWKLSPNVIDIGFYLPPSYSGHKIYLYIPCPDINCVKVSDLGRILIDQNVTRNALFNDILTGSEIVNTAQHCFVYKVEGVDNPIPVYICSLEDQIELSKQYNGVVISFTIRTVAVESPAFLYIRARLDGSFINNSFDTVKLPSSFMQYFTSKYETFDLRINEKRTVDHTLAATFPSGKASVISGSRAWLNFDKINCFFMCKAGEDLALAKSSPVQARPIEAEIWQAYQPSLRKLKQGETAIAYQWRLDSPPKKQQGAVSNHFKSFKLFVKIHSNIFTFKKLLLILVLGAIFSISCGVATIKFDQWINGVNDNHASEYRPESTTKDAICSQSDQSALQNKNSETDKGPE